MKALSADKVKNEFEFKTNEKRVWTCITYKTKVNSDISMMIYYLLFLFLVERKKYVRIEQKIIKEKKQHMHVHYKLNKRK